MPRSPFLCCELARHLANNLNLAECVRLGWVSRVEAIVPREAVQARVAGVSLGVLSAAGSTESTAIYAAKEGGIGVVVDAEEARIAHVASTARRNDSVACNAARHAGPDFAAPVVTGDPLARALVIRATLLVLLRPTAGDAAVRRLHESVVARKPTTAPTAGCLPIGRRGAWIELARLTRTALAEGGPTNAVAFTGLAGVAAGARLIVRRDGTTALAVAIPGPARAIRAFVLEILSIALRNAFSGGTLLTGPAVSVSATSISAAAHACLDAFVPTTLVVHPALRARTHVANASKIAGALAVVAAS